jgi:hypothetical protein
MPPAADRTTAPPSAVRSTRFRADRSATGRRALELLLVVAFVAPTATAQPATACLPWGNQDTINERLVGPDAAVALCANAFFELTGPIVFTADGQRLYTEGFPTDERRATLRVAAADLTTAVVMTDRSFVLLANLTIDGNRPGLGARAGDALVLAGGVAVQQTIRANRILEPRSWSALHLHEGPEPRCRGALVEDNVIGPAGRYDGTWADGISYACTDGVVRRNLIVDATDGGIVVFGGRGSVIEDNVIRAETRTLLGGINLVDFAPYAGDYRGTVVRRNVIEAAGATVRIGIGMGPRVWVCLDGDAERANPTLYGATVADNVLRGAPFQYGYVVDGVRDWTVTGNRSEASHAGAPELDCRGRVPSAPAAFLIEPTRSAGTFQPEFRDAQLELALWTVRAPEVLPPE